MMLHRRHGNRAFPIRRTPRSRYEIDRVCRPPREDHFALAVRSDKLRNACASRLQTPRRLQAQRMGTAMHVGVTRTVMALYRCKNLIGHVCRSGIVEIHQRASVHLARKNREVRTNTRDIEHGFIHGCLQAAAQSSGTAAQSYRFRTDRTRRRAVCAAS